MITDCETHTERFLLTIHDVHVICNIHKELYYWTITLNWTETIQCCVLPLYVRGGRNDTYWNLDERLICLTVPRQPGGLCALEV
ncbi:unnamed protein product [Allacma fusca]|uniref:Uncharacterized protein n=1 Tax=Allacma fusca TaxID=39272 RepID=A0A8J2K4L0_9HEXA|nr:unnamed protein product [Allacma fusca]